MPYNGRNPHLGEIMSNTAKKTTLEEVWKVIKEVGESQKETDRQLKETDRQIKESQKETDRQIKATHKEINKKLDRLSETVEETNKAVDKTNRSIEKTNGNFNNKWGKFVENLVRGDLVKLLRKQKIEVNRIQPNLVYPAFEENRAGELDLVAINGDELVVVEVKSTLEKADVKRFLEKLKIFKRCPTEYKGKTLYGGVAFLQSIKNAEAYAEEQGLFTIRAPGGDSNVCAITNAKGFQPRAI